MTLSDILSRLEGVQGRNGQYSAKCPAHDDRRNSLSVSAGEDGKILLHCHAGCSAGDAEQVGKDTGLFVDPSYLYKVFTGERDAPKIKASIEKILSLTPNAENRKEIK